MMLLVKKNTTFLMGVGFMTNVELMEAWMHFIEQGAVTPVSGFTSY